MHPRLSDGERSYDIEIATEYIAGEMFDLQAAGLLSDSLDVLAEVAALRPRYEQLWTELTDDVVVPAGENYCINARLRRLNELGFDVPELTIKTEPDGSVHYDAQVVDAGHDQRRLFELTGLRGNPAPAPRFRTTWPRGPGWIRSSTAR